VMSTGLAVAMYTTLAGLIGAILLKAQYLLLEAATTKLFWDVVRTTETKIVPALERPDV
jgi:biopolymer transport protein ExbB/TolQ